VLQLRFNEARPACILCFAAGEMLFSASRGLIPKQTPPTSQHNNVSYTDKQTLFSLSQTICLFQQHTSHLS
jgi:hypothetical protein